MDWKERFRRLRSLIELEESRERQAAKQAEIRKKEREKLKHKLRSLVKNVCKQFARGTKGKLAIERARSHDYFSISWRELGFIGLACYYPNHIVIKALGIADYVMPFEGFTKDKLVAKLEEFCRKMFELKASNSLLF